MGVTLEWAYTTGDFVASSPYLVDLNNDGSLEILIGSADKNLYCLYSDGSLQWNYTTGKEVRSSPAIADLKNE